MKIQGHRGYAELYPENTMLAFKKCYDSGADYIEMDIRITKDGQYVCLHDTTIDRTSSGGTGKIKELTYEQANIFDYGKFKNNIFQQRSDCKLPLFTDVLTYFKNLDIKIMAHFNLDTGTEVRNLCSIIENMNCIDKIIGFGNIAVINIIKEELPNCITCNGDMPDINNYKTYLDNAISKGHEIVSITFNETVGNINTMINEIKRNGKEVHLSYASLLNYSKLKELDNSNIDYILSDNPNALFDLKKRNMFAYVEPFGNIKLTVNK